MSETVHQAIVKIGVDDKKEFATIILVCLQCEGEIRFEIPAVHLPTLANACAQAAATHGLTSIHEQVAKISTTDRDGRQVDERLMQLRSKAHLN